MQLRTAIFIPARLGSQRFPNKPLIKLYNKAMILHVLDRARETGIKDIYVACAEQEIADIVSKNGGKAILTPPNCPSGTDRIFAALKTIEENYDVIVNLQGDLPLIDAEIITQTIAVLENPNVDIATIVSKIEHKEEKTDPNIVKAVLSFPEGEAIGRALYFTRAQAPYGQGDLYRHIGLYAYTWEALKKFISFQPTPLEKREKLEQLRALEHGMRIDVRVISQNTTDVNTPEDAEHVASLLQGR